MLVSRAMRRLTAFLLLSSIAFFLGLAAWEDCEADEGGCPPGCHLTCADGCGVAPSVEAPAPRVTLVPLEAVGLRADLLPASFAPRPEIDPPRF